MGKIKKFSRGSRSAISDPQIEDYCQAYVWPYLAQTQQIRKPYSLLTISDTHATFLDPFVWASFLTAIQVLKPDGVCFNGDTLEGSELSGYTKIPGWTIPLQLEFDFQREMVKQVRRVHDGDFFVGAGNHGLDRLVKYLASDARALASLDCVRIDKLMGLEDFDVQLMQHGNRFSPKNEEHELPGFLLNDHFYIYHGTAVAKHSAYAELSKIGWSGMSGHIHRAQVFYGGTMRHPAINWMSLPCGCTDKAAASYIRAPYTGWQKGFGYTEVHPNGHVYQTPAVEHHGTISVQGLVLNRPAGLPDGDPQLNWLKGFTLKEHGPKCRPLHR